MNVPTIRYVTADEIETERATLLAQAGIDRATLEARGERYLLSPEQRAILA